MKTKNWFKTVLLTSVVAFSACKKSSDDKASPNVAGQVTVTLDGDGINGQTVAINNVSGVPHNGGMYITGNKYTVVKFSDKKANADNTVDSFLLAFDGAGKGVQKFGTKLTSGDDNIDNVQVVLSVHVGTKLYLLESESGSVTVDSYDSVGGTISGTFTGKFVDDANNKAVTVTSAQFKVPRIADIPKSI